MVCGIVTSHMTGICDVSCALRYATQTTTAIVRLHHLTSLVMCRVGKGARAIFMTSSMQIIRTDNAISARTSKNRDVVVIDT